MFFFTGASDGQDNWGKEETILISLYNFHPLRYFQLPFRHLCTIFCINTYAKNSFHQKSKWWTCSCPIIMNIFLVSNVKMTRKIEVNKNDAYCSKWQKLATSLLPWKLFSRSSREPLSLLPLKNKKIWLCKTNLASLST